MVYPLEKALNLLDFFQGIPQAIDFPDSGKLTVSGIIDINSGIGVVKNNITPILGSKGKSRTLTLGEDTQVDKNTYADNKNNENHSYAF
jgi:hypothetical protein